jgi:hypothetical protein
MFQRILNGNLPFGGGNTTLNITNMAEMFDKETGAIQNTISTLTTLVQSKVLPAGEQQSILTLLTQLNSTFNAVVEAASLVNAVQSIQSLEKGSSGFTSATCPLANEAGVWAAVQNCSRALCRGTEVFSSAADFSVQAGGGTGAGPQLNCDDDSLYLESKSRFVATIHYECGATHDVPILSAVINGTNVRVSVSHRCLCPHSGGLQACSSKHRIDNEMDQHAVLEV